MEVRGDADRDIRGVGHRHPHDVDELHLPVGVRDEDLTRSTRRARSRERLGDHGQPAAVVEHRLDLHHRDDVRNTGQHVVDGEHGAAGRDRLGQPSAVPRDLGHRVGDQRGGFGHVQSQPSRPAGSGELGRREEQKAIAFLRGQMHGSATRAP